MVFAVHTFCGITQTTLMKCIHVPIIMDLNSISIDHEVARVPFSTVHNSPSGTFIYHRPIGRHGLLFARLTQPGTCTIDKGNMFAKSRYA